MTKVKDENLKISDIKQYEKNAKMHSRTQIAKIAESIKRFGFNVPIVIDKNNVLIAGHGRYAAAKLLGLETVKLGLARAKVGERLIPAILVDDLSEAEIKAYRLADNKLNESEWNMDLALAELKGLDLPLFDLTGFDRDLLLDKELQDDELPDEVKKPKSKLGDIYELGKHRVICGDSTKDETFTKLMDGQIAQMCFTDPPYNVDYQGGMGTHEQNKRSGILNDKMSKSAFGYFLHDALRQIVNNVRGGVRLHVVFGTRFSQRSIRASRRTLAIFYYLGQKQFYFIESGLPKHVRADSLRLASERKESPIYRSERPLQCVGRFVGCKNRIRRILYDNIIPGLQG